MGLRERILRKKKRYAIYDINGIKVFGGFKRESQALNFRERIKELGKEHLEIGEEKE